MAGRWGGRARAWLVAGVAALAAAAPSGLQAQTARDPGFAGLQIQPADHAARVALGAADVSGGVLVRDIAPGGPGETAGLRRGDLLLSYEGVSIAGLNQLVAFMQATKPAGTISFTVRREGAERIVSLPLSDWPEGWRVDTDSTALVPGLGLTARALTPDVREGAGVRWGRVGVLAAEVEPASPAAAAGLKAGDLLVAIGRSPVTDPADVEGLLSDAGDDWMALVERDAAVLLVGPGAPSASAVVAGQGVLAARLGDGPYVMDVSLDGPDGIKPGSRLKAMPQPAPRSVAAERAIPEAGLRAATLSQQARAQWPVRWSAQGVVVVAVEPASRASLAGLRPGHVIHSINQMPVDSLDDLGPLTDPAATLMVVAEDLAGFTILTVEPQGGLPQAAPPARRLLRWGAREAG